MKKLILFLAGMLTCFGQATVFTPVCPLNPPTAGIPFTWSVNLVGQPQGASQFTLLIPSGSTGVSVAAGAAATAAQKPSSFANNIALFWGMNLNLIQPGTLAVITMTIPTAGSYQLGITAPFGAGVDPNTTPLSTAANPPCAVSVLPNLSKCDINGDGATDQLDVALEDSWAHNNPAVPLVQCNKNGDGGCNVIDVQIIIRAVVTGVCSAI